MQKGHFLLNGMKRGLLVHFNTLKELFPTIFLFQEQGKTLFLLSPEKNSPKNLHSFQKKHLSLPSTLEVLSLFWQLRRALKRQNAKTAYAEPKVVRSTLTKPYRGGQHRENRKAQPFEVGKSHYLM